MDSFDNAARKALFGVAAEKNIPGAGESAAKVPERHTRMKITINLDSDVIQYFKDEAQKEGVGYQLLINQTLRDYVHGNRSDRIAKEVGEILLSDSSFLKQLREQS